MIDIADLFSGLSKSTRARIRFFLNGEIEPTDWGTWVISPSKGYLEHETFGPFRIVDAAKCQIAVDVPNSNDVSRILDGGFCDINRGIFELNLQAENNSTS